MYMYVQLIKIESSCHYSNMYFNTASLGTDMYVEECVCLQYIPIGVEGCMGLSGGCWHDILATAVRQSESMVLLICTQYILTAHCEPKS